MVSFASSVEYCAIADVQDRGLISTSNSNYNTAITNAIIEASRLVDTFLTPYITVPLTGTAPDAIIYITADFAMSIFKRRYTPAEAKVRGPLQPDMINDVDGTGWFALGLKKILDYIKSTYGLGSVGTPNSPENTGIMINPEIYKDLFAKGIITLQEARKFMANAVSAVNEVINKMFTTNDTKTISYLETQNIHYPTKAQHSFGFIHGKNNVYNTLGGYIKDSDSPPVGGSTE